MKAICYTKTGKLDSYVKSQNIHFFSLYETLKNLNFDYQY